MKLQEFKYLVAIYVGMGHGENRITESHIKQIYEIYSFEESF